MFEIWHISALIAFKQSLAFHEFFPFPDKAIENVGEMGGSLCAGGAALQWARPALYTPRTVTQILTLQTFLSHALLECHVRLLFYHEQEEELQGRVQHDK